MGPRSKRNAMRKDHPISSRARDMDWPMHIRLDTPQATDMKLSRNIKGLVSCVLSITYAHLRILRTDLKSIFKEKSSTASWISIQQLPRVSRWTQAPLPSLLSDVFLPFFFILPPTTRQGPVPGPQVPQPASLASYFPLLACRPTPLFHTSVACGLRQVFVEKLCFVRDLCVGWGFRS